jgi:citrate lyase beta subunit
VTRSMLFVPATRWAVIEKAATSPADAVCIDLEDSVPPDEKAASRANVIRAFRELDFGSKKRLVRINGIETQWAHGDVIEVVEAIGTSIDEIMIPKVASAHHVAFIETLLRQLESRCGLDRAIALHGQIETAAGFVWLREIASASRRLTTVSFGAGDYAASMRMPAAAIGVPDANDAEYAGHRWHAVMHGIVAAARTFGLACMDGPFASFQDVEGLERSCRTSRALGFDGKQCIHPAQIPVIHRVFTATAADLAHARRVIDAFDRAASEGRGSAAIDGTMIDEASVRMARTALDQSPATGSAQQ